MSDNLVVVKSIIEAHHAIKGHVKLVGDSVSDLEAVFSLQKAQSGWGLSSAEALAEKQARLQQTMSWLEEGLKNHFSFEEKALSPLLGELLMRALILEHREIDKAIGEAKSRMAHSQLEELSREELLSQKSEIQQAIGNICQMIEEHAMKEETLLKMLQRALG